MHSAYVFDAYGTLFDVHAAVRKHADAVGEDHAQLSEVWRHKQLEFTWTPHHDGTICGFLGTDQTGAGLCL